MIGQPTSTYQEFSPHRPLAPFLICTWSQQIGQGEAVYHQRVLPDGCIDVVVQDEEPPFVAGPATRTNLVGLRPGSTVVGVRFRPGLAASLLGTPANLIRDRVVPLSELWGSTALHIGERVAQYSTAQARVRQLERALLARLPQVQAVDETVVEAVAWMARHTSGGIAQLCHALGISRRQLHRRFNASVGYGPKTLQRILRFQRVLDLSHHHQAASRLSMAALALEAGYADQAHMSRDVHELSDLPPSSLLENAASALAMADFFKTMTEPSPKI